VDVGQVTGGWTWFYAFKVAEAAMGGCLSSVTSASPKCGYFGRIHQPHHFFLK
jgi:hypothetical protein